MEKPRIQRVDVRMPEDVYAAVVQAAQEDTRSVNAQIIALLRESLRRRKGRKS
ncbi:MAG TPA: Arc family DNA-binding protein [Chloroflexota bacterium]|nr:Arc family DNA-binding protein [Chloroflexota bacterium]